MIQQRTPEWFDARRGKPTSSQMWRIMAGSESWNVYADRDGEGEVVSNHTSEEAAHKKAIALAKKDGSYSYSVGKRFNPSAERQAYMTELLAERLTGSVEERYTTAAMQRGVDMEPIALMAYEAVTGNVTKPGHWFDYGSWGCTPDAFVVGGGIVEVKCPMTKTIVRQRCFEPEIPPEYYWQMVAQMAATGAEWCDLVYYDDRFARLEHQMWIRRAQYSADDWSALSEQLAIFCAELDALTREYGADKQADPQEPSDPLAIPAFLDKRNSASGDQATGADGGEPDGLSPQPGPPPTDAEVGACTP